jgi:hypothetical protein
MCSILCWILSIWEALGWKFWIFGLIHALSTRGRSLSLKGLAGCIQKVFRWFWAIYGLWCAPVWPVKVTGLTDQSAGPVHMLSTDLTGGGDWSDWWELSVAAALFQVVLCMHWSRGSCIGSGGACMCAGGALCGFFELCFGGLCSLLEHSFVLDVSSRCPFLRGMRLAFFKWSRSLSLFGFRSLCWSFFIHFFFFFLSLLLPYVDVVNALINGEIEDHVWFEDRWMVASLCDGWLTTLCGLILG